MQRYSLGTIDLKNLEKINTFEDLAKDIYISEEKKIAFNKLIDTILENKQRIILVIDELDRCKPTYAVEMLETIKHFYSNKKITVIVCTNNAELSNTVKKFYGNDFDGYGYLDKFYDCIINLELKDIKKYLQNQNFCEGTYIYHDFSYLIMKYLNFSLRDCNRYLTLYNLLKNYIETESSFEQEKNYIYSCLILPMTIAYKIKNINQYQLLVNNKGEQLIKEFLNKMVIGTSNEGWLKRVLRSDDNYINKIIEIYKSLFNTNTLYEEIPFFEAISFLGTKILLENKDEE